jgi:hypothetical protein
VTPAHNNGATIVQFNKHRLKQRQQQQTCFQRQITGHFDDKTSVGAHHRAEPAFYENNDNKQQ